MKILDLTILAYEGPILRAYCGLLKTLGFKAKLCIKLFKGDSVGKKQLRWLPTRLRNNFLYTRESTVNNFWPKQFSKDSVLFHSIRKTIVENYNLNEDFFDTLTQLVLNSESFSEKTIYCEYDGSGLKCENLYRLLTTLGPQTYLFTGGGFMPNRILDIPHTQFIHIHPGYLPYIRGADGILWSTLIRQKPGAACFYMVPQCDEGPLIFSHEVPALKFSIPQNYMDLDTQYRLTFSFYDPAIRALTLKHVLEQYDRLDHLPTHTQNLSQGITYHFMHDIIKQLALNKIWTTQT